DGGERRERSESATVKPKPHSSVESAWSFLMHLEEEAAQGRGKNGDEEEEEEAEGAGKDVPENHQLLHLNDGAKLVIAMVGKPARGKTFLAAKIQRYLEWLGYKVKHVETVQVRRKMFGKVEPDDFFDPNSVEMTEHRTAAQKESLKTAVEWLQDGGQVVIYDATNSTRTRRDWVSDYISENLIDKTENATVMSHRVLWLESFCEDSEQIVQNFLELRKKNPEFTEHKDLSTEEAVSKFMDKLKFYDAEYEALDGEKEDRCFIKLTDFGKSLTVNKVQGFLESKLVSFCMNIHTKPRVIILVRHGQSEYNLQDRIGGDPNLTEAGFDFGKNLAKFIEENAHNGIHPVDPNLDFRSSSSSNGNGEHAAAKDAKGELANGDKEKNPFAFVPSEDLYVWTSNLKRTRQTVKHVKCRANVQWVSLAEIDAGMCECMTYNDFREQLAIQYMKRQRNKAAWRYPGGESYIDVKRRLEPVIFELERQQKPVLVCAHRAVLRCLYSYFCGIPVKRAPFLPFPLHTALVLTPTSDGWTEDRFPIEPNVGDLGAHEQDVEAAAAKIKKTQAKKRRLAQQEFEQQQQKKNVEAFRAPKYELEQYPTSAHIAARILYAADSVFDDVQDKAVLDLGCGTGMLAIAAQIMGSGFTAGIDLDQEALQVAEENVEDMQVDVDLMHGDVTRLPFRPASFDTVVMNPPFGTRNKGVDVRFLEAALASTRGAVYSLHKSSTRDFLKKKALDEWRVSFEVVAQLRFNIPRMYKFHRKESADVAVDLIRLCKAAPETPAEAIDSSTATQLPAQPPPTPPATPAADASAADASAADAPGNVEPKAAPAPALTTDASV
ncbi:6-P2ase 3) (PFK/FBPase 3) (6PF-2-K/Fru-2, partial [Durusdinium trenchii]